MRGQLVAVTNQYESLVKKMAFSMKGIAIRRACDYKEVRDANTGSDAL